MDLSKIFDITMLKSMAFDQTEVMRQTKHNLGVIRARIAEVEASRLRAPAGPSAQTEPPTEPPTEPSVSEPGVAATDSPDANNQPE